MDLDQLFYAGQKAFIEKDGEVLLLFDNLGLDFPGGKIRKGEKDLAEALKREVREETTLEIEVGEIFTSWIVEFPPYDRTTNFVFLTGYYCTYVSGDMKLSDEHDKFIWVNKDNYMKYKVENDYFQALDKYFKTRPF